MTASQEGLVQTSRADPGPGPKPWDLPGPPLGLVHTEAGPQDSENHFLISKTSLHG